MLLPFVPVIPFLGIRPKEVILNTEQENVLHRDVQCGAVCVSTERDHRAVWGRGLEWR